MARVSYYSPYSVAEFAWALALAVDRRIVRAAHRTREFDFGLDGLMGRDLRGRTAGVVGTGKIGAAFARIAHGFGMRLLGWDVAENPDCLALGMEYVERERLFAEADLVSLHVPLVEDTHHLVDARALAAMKDDAILVNSSRGGLVDTDALLETLRAGRLSGVGLDVYEEEAGVFFLDKSLDVMTDERLARLMTFNNVLVTSHRAYFTRAPSVRSPPRPWRTSPTTSPAAPATTRSSGRPLPDALFRPGNEAPLAHHKRDGRRHLSNRGPGASCSVVIASVCGFRVLGGAAGLTLESSILLLPEPQGAATTLTDPAGEAPGR